MPYLMIQTNQTIDAEKTRTLMSNASRTVAELLGKSENYVTIAVLPAMPMMFAGSDAPLAYLALKSIDLPESTTPDLSQSLCHLINNELNIPMNRIYIEFSNAQRHLWGWNGRTF